MPTSSHRLLEGYSAVIFDCDDTVIETANTRWIALETAARQFDININKTIIRASWGKPFHQLIADLVPGVDLERFLVVYRQVMQSLPPRTTPGAVELLKVLQERGIRLEIVTSSRKELIVQDLETVDLRSYFRGIWGYEETEPYHKPDPRVLQPILTALHSSGIQHSGVIYIGDSVRDYQVARGNGLHFIAATTGLEDRSLFLAEHLDSDRIVASLEELVPVH